MPVAGAFQGIMITGIHAGRFFTVPANRGEGSVFAQRSNPVILWMIKIIASHSALFALITNI